MAVSLWNQSAYSLLQSTCRLQDLVTQAQIDKQTAIALCDTNVLSGTIAFYRLCLQQNIRPIIGMTVHYDDAKIIVLAKNNQGYQALVKMTTAIQLYKQTQSEIEQYITEDVIVILPNIHTELSAAYATKNVVLAGEIIDKYKVYTQDVYLGICSYTQEQNIFWQKVCGQVNVKAVALHKTRMTKAEQEKALAVLELIRSGEKKTIEQLRGKFGYDETQWTQQQFRLAFQQWPEAVENSEYIASICDVQFDLEARLLPAYPLPHTVSSTNVYLQSLCIAGLRKRYGYVQQYQYERLAYELRIIDEMGFNDYFLIVWDFIKYARQQGIAIGPGRGSAVGSLVAYCLGITNCDPLVYGLLFERFLNPERVTLPDIDIDIEDDRRQEVIDYVRDKYGSDRVVQIATFGTFATKAAFREVARILDASPKQLAMISKILPSTVVSLDQAYETLPKLRELLSKDSFLAQVFSIARQIEGLPRNVSTHAAGIIIGATSLEAMIPLQAGMGATAATQYTMNELEALGLLKMDFLGLRNLSLIKRVVTRIQVQNNPEFDIQHIPLDDSDVYAMLQVAQTTGIFQLESGGMRAALRQIKPNQFEDIVATLALFRPGPMENIPVYSRRKLGEEPVTYPDEQLQEILAPTYGIIIYQEQIMQIATTLAGYSLGEADILRRAISKKNETILAQERERFVDRCVMRHVHRVKADAIYDLIVKFANYGFNKSHAVAYGYLAYQLGYLKVHYATFFWCELLNSVIQSDSKVYEYLQAAKQQGITIMKPSIQTGNMYFEVVDQQLQIGLLTIKHVGSAAVQAVNELRNEKPFIDFKETLLRLKAHRSLTKATIGSFIDAGAFDCFQLNHAMMHDELENTHHQLDLLNFDGGGKYISQTNEQPEYSQQELMDREVAVYGYHLFTHPLIAYRNQWSKLPTLAQIGIHTSMIQILLYVEKVRSIRTKNGEIMQFISGSDEFAQCECVAFPKVFAKYGESLQIGNCLLIRGKIEQRQSQQQIVIYEVQKLTK